MVSSIIIAQNSTSYGQISSKPKTRPRTVEAKAEARGLRGQGHKILSSRSRPVLEDPIPAVMIMTNQLRNNSQVTKYKIYTIGTH